MPRPSFNLHRPIHFLNSTTRLAAKSSLSFSKRPSPPRCSPLRPPDFFPPFLSQRPSASQWFLRESHVRLASAIRTRQAPHSFSAHVTPHFPRHVTPHFLRTSHPISPARHTPFPPHITPHFPRTSQAIHLLHTSHAIPRTSHPICPIICHRHFFRARPHTSRTRSLRRRISTCPPSISSLETAFSSSTTSLLGGAPPTPW